jgi:GH24 family phage-related lysozyme (muramidase)
MTRRLIDCVRHSNLELPHHRAFWELVESKLPAEFLADAGQGGSLWLSTPATKQPLSLEPGLRLIREFEGCHLTAYRCPAGVWTIGWGNTRHADGRPVREGDTITQSQADQLLAATVESIVAQLAKIPHWGSMTANQRGALLSFAFNLGAGFYGAAGFETITQRLRDKDWAKVPDALLLYRNPGSAFEAGLRRRREAEGRLWATGVPSLEVQQQPAKLSPDSPFTARITPHIQIGEFALWQEARRFDHQHQIDTAAELAAFMERARRQFGGKPVIITSGYRPPAINRSVGGASKSEHLYDAPGVGAVDFLIKGVSVHALQQWCDQHWPYSLGYGAPEFVHLGIRQGRPRVRWDY